ncbi:PBP1A family penicillin-binding protein [Paenibacillus sp. YIM B09110]|uniref:PBP1A family penicillin-binding protein n=1 Tax=Paenibacillus sp. YIM B09110 TaxID=3126102 RepID=UPI00301DD843
MAEQPRRKTATKKGKKKKISGRKLFFGLFFTVVIAIVCGIIGYLFIILNGERLLEENGSKLDFGEASIIYDQNDKEIARLYDPVQTRDVAEFSEIPELLFDAVVATEDQRFFEHSGIDFFAIGRAVVKDVIARSAVEGGSTITQQLAKNVFLSADKTFFRKATEASIAVALEQQMSKQEILTMYLNRIFFGGRIYGVKRASEYYFDKDVKDLELWEAATLAAMPKAPNSYNPIKHPINSKERRAVVLKLMYDQKYITLDQMEEAKAVDYVPPKKVEQDNQDVYQAYVDYVVEEAMEKTKLSEEELRIGGYQIYTSLNQQAQKSVDKAFNNDDNFEQSSDEQISQAAMIIMDHRDGTIQAMAGGRDYVIKGTNRVVAKRQSGSTIKPISVYGPAIATGKYFPWTELKNDKKCFGSNYCPRDKWGPVPVTMKQAMKDSRNLAAVWTLNEIGVKRGISYAEKFGLEVTKDNNNLAIALGTIEATPLQMATAYSVFANGGKSVDPHTIRKIEGGKQANYTYKAPAVKQLISEQEAWYMTEMLQAVVEKGGSGVKANFGRALAGKTGTTQHGIPASEGYKGNGIRDAWFVGYTPEWTAAVWMGYDKTNATHVLEKGSPQAAAFFAKVMEPAMKGMSSSSFNQPGGVKDEKPPVGIQNFNAVYLPEEAKVYLTWDQPEEEGMTYKVYRKEASEAEFIHFVDSINTSVDDMSVFPGMTYEYYVTSYDAESDQEGTPSAKVSVAIPETEIEIPDIPMEPTPSDDIDPGDGTNGGNGDGNGNGDGGTNLPGEPTQQPGNPDEGTGEPTPTPDSGDGGQNGGQGNSNTLGNTGEDGNTAETGGL